jgi:putative addiction module component (TIGR02574 family)
MARDFKDIVAEALGLPIAARAELATELLESLEDVSEEENERLWAEEAERRYADYKAGRLESVSADELFARLQSRAK